jgi:hypothetical protein
MSELLTESIKPVNLPFTILLGVMVLYWVFYLLGALGSDVLDFMGLDLDGDVDLDANGDLSAEGSHGGLASFLRFFHLGELPVVVIFSVLILCMWILSLLINRLLNTSQLWVAAVLFVPILLAGLMITKALITPFVPWLKQVFDQTGDVIEVVGKTCVITSMEATAKYGQAEIKQQGAPLVLNVKTREGTTLRKGEEAIVYEYEKATNTYLVAEFDLGQIPDGET